MAGFDNPYKDGASTNVAGSTPLSSGQPSEQPSGSSSTPMSGTSGEAIQSGQEPSQGPQTVNKGSGKASSGQYTNIQKYIAKNKPQAQQMTQAVTQDIGKQASSIRSAADQQKAQQDKLLKANEQAMTQATGQAQAAVNQIMETQPQEGQPQYQAASQEQFKKFMEGDVGQQDVGELNLAKQQNRANALQQLAGRANTEQGRRDLLGQTFQKQADYTRGMSGLDQLITGGDQAAREQLIQGTKGQAEDLTSGLQGLAQTATTERSAQQEALSQIGEQIRGIGTEAETGLDTDIQTAYENELNMRKALFGENSPEYQAALTGAGSRLGSMQSSLDNYGNTIGELIPGAYQRATERGIGSIRDAASTNLQQYAQNLKDFEETGKLKIQTGTRQDPNNWAREIPVYKDLTGQAAQDYLNRLGGARVSHHKNRQAVGGMLDLLNRKFTGDSNDLYGIKNIGADFGESGGAYAQTLGTSKDYFQKQLQGLGSAEDVVKRKLAEVGGADFDTLASGGDISKYEVADQAQIDKINALKNIMGKQDIITEQQRGDGKYADINTLKNLLSRYTG